MGDFSYKIMIGGRPERGVVAANDIREAAAFLRRKNSIILDLAECRIERGANASAKRNSRGNGGGGTFDRILSGLLISKKSLELSARNLAVLIKGGVPILTALEVCASQAKGRLGRAYLTVAEKIRAGKSLEESVAEEMPFVGKLTLGLVKVGESNGALDAMLLYAADIMERSRKIRNDVIQAMSYPCLVTLMSLGAGFYITTVAIPKITALLGSKRRILPPITLALLDVSAFVRAHWAAILLIPLAAFVALLLARRNPVLGERIDQWLLRIPLLGKAFRTSANSLWARNLGMLLRSGIDIISAIKLTAEGLPNIRVRKELERAGEMVRSGTPLSESIRKTDIAKLSPLAASMVEIGENTGTVDDGLLYVADFNEKELERRLDFLSRMIEPAMLVIVGGMVAFVYMAFFMGLMAVTRGAGGM